MTMLTAHERSVLERLVFASEVDPSMPSFPVTRTYPITVGGMENVWLKDESTNETGTHKDRMAWEIVMAYKDILMAKEKGFTTSGLPSLSIISAGSAAVAVQTQLRRYGLPNLKALIDQSTDECVVQYLESLGTEVFCAELADRPLSPDDILEMTDNQEGFDITSNRAFDPGAHFYDWLSYEILNQDPDYVFVPFGTGQLYGNIIGIGRRIAEGEVCESVYVGSREKIPRMNFIGATTNNPESKAVKLYAPFRPFTAISANWVRLGVQRGWCGEKSGIVEVEESSILDAYRILTDQGIPVEHSAVAGLAALLEMRDQVAPDDKLLVVSTGKLKTPC